MSVWRRIPKNTHAEQTSKNCSNSLVLSSYQHFYKFYSGLSIPPDTESLYVILIRVLQITMMTTAFAEHNEHYNPQMGESNAKQ